VFSFAKGKSIYLKPMQKTEIEDRKGQKSGIKMIFRYGSLMQNRISDKQNGGQKGRKLQTIQELETKQSTKHSERTSYLESWKTMTKRQSRKDKGGSIGF